jgi:dipeptidyl aminopeptidase/acylaminoacyl peptidase
MPWKILIASFTLALALTAQSAPNPATSGTKRPFTFEDMMALKRVGEPVPSPDGKWVVFAVVDVDLAANTKKSHLWIVPAAGGEARRLNQTPNHEERPRFSPDGKRLIWTSKATDPTQIWMSNFTPDSGGLDGTPHQVTNISTGADGAIWSPDGKNIVFVSSVYPDCDSPSLGYGAPGYDACNKQRDEEIEKSKVKAKIFTKLLYRHWTSYTEHKRSHVFAVSAEADASQPNTARDLTQGDHDVPPFNLGGQDMYSVSPDGQELAYTSNIDEVEATSTNNDIFIVPMAGPAAAGKKISTSPGNDNTPVYSPDGKYVAWKSMARAGFEADKSRLFLQDRQSGQTHDLTDKFDLSVGDLVWMPDSKAIYFTAEDHGNSPICSVGVNKEDQPIKLVGGHNGDLVFTKDGASLFFTRMSIGAPNEIFGNSFPIRRGVKTYTPEDEGAAASVKLTHVNDALLSKVEMQPLEPFTFKGANNDDVQGFMIKPPGFDLAKKYPLKFLIHGGPQGAWGNSWSYRWNGELFAANGYVVVMINFHGSTGYGQKFTDSISGDWGGKPYVDLMKGLDYVEKTYPFIDKNREAALGASYGGYMANWLLGHTDRFKCIVSHDGVFNTESAYGTTEELWFSEWEFKGTPWKNRELYRKFSPHLFADKFKTPTLVVHGQLDFRLDVSEGFQLFTTLQRLKVPSKMLYFPDEGHWVLKPQNSRLWWKTVNDWVDQWCGDKH